MSKVSQVTIKYRGGRTSIEAKGAAAQRLFDALTAPKPAVPATPPEVQPEPQPEPQKIQIGPLDV